MRKARPAQKSSRQQRSMERWSQVSTILFIFSLSKLIAGSGLVMIGNATAGLIS
jgi:hypothetical protein